MTSDFGVLLSVDPSDNAHDSPQVLQARLQEQTILLSISTAIARIHHLDDLITLINQSVKPLFGLPSVALFVVEPSGLEHQVWMQDLSAIAAPQPPTAFLPQRFPHPQSLIEYWMTADTPQWWDGAELQQQGWHHPILLWMADSRQCYAIAAPLRLQDQTIGLFCLLSDTPALLTASQVSLLDAVTMQLAIAVHNLQINADRQRHQAELEQQVAELHQLNSELAQEKKYKEILLSISEQIATVRDKRELLRLVLQEIQPIFDFYDCGLFIVNKDGQYHQDLAVLNPDISPSDANYALFEHAPILTPHPGSLVEQIIDELAVANQPILYDFQDLFQRQPEYPQVQVMQDFAYRDCLATNLRVGGNIFGFFCINSFQKNHFRVEQFSLFQQIADLLAVAIANILATEEIEQRADELEHSNANLQRALNQLADSENRFRALFELGNEGFHYVKVEPPIPTDLPVEQQVELYYRRHRVVQVNQAFAEMYGVTDPAELVGLTMADVHVENSEKNLAFVKTFVESSYRSSNIETEEIDIHGAIRYFLNSGVGSVKDGCLTDVWCTQIDITELRQTQRALLHAEQDRTELLKTITAIANQLLRSADYVAVLPDVLSILGKAANADRCSLAQNLIDPQTGEAAIKMHTEWCRDRVQPSVVHTPELDSALSWELFPDGYGLLVQGITIRCWVDELPDPARQILREQGNVAVVMVPIQVQGQFWGVFSFDYCHPDRLPNDSNGAIFAIAVDSIAAAIERQTKEDELRDALQTMATRDRLLGAVSRAANALLTVDNVNAAVNVAISILGDALDTDRVCIIENFNQSSDYSAIGWRILYEWDSPGTIPQLAHPEVSKGTYQGLEDWYGQFLQGQSLICQLEDLPEPLRSGQAKLGVKVLHVIPIVVDGLFWGLVGFDDCREARQRSDGELAILKIAAACVGGAIQRDRIQQAYLRAEQQRSAEFAKANDALKRSLDALATEPNLDQFLGQVLTAIAHQFGAPLSEYWYHADETMAYIGMMSYQGQVYNRDQIAELYPDHPGVVGFQVPSAMIHGETLQSRKRYFVIEDWLSNPFVKEVSWGIQRGLYKEINVPMVLGSQCVGALIVRMPKEYSITTQQIELAQALAHQATLAAELTRLTEQVKQSAIVNERNRMAREIHDTLAQTFTGIVMQLEAAKSALPNRVDVAQARIHRASEIARQGLAQARQSVHALRSGNVESRDLPIALQQLVKQMTEGIAVQSDIRIEGTPRPLPTDIEENLLRIGQEALTNAIRHANAQTIRLTLLFEDSTVHLHIVDDGQGFDPNQSISSSGFGIIGMQERSHIIRGEFLLNSKPGQGTCITVSVEV